MYKHILKIDSKILLASSNLFGWLYAPAHRIALK